MASAMLVMAVMYLTHVAGWASPPYSFCEPYKVVSCQRELPSLPYHGSKQVRSCFLNRRHFLLSIRNTEFFALGSFCQPFHWLILPSSANTHTTKTTFYI